MCLVILMNNIKIEALQERVEQSFEKPDKDFLNDKECLICLEPMDLEMNQNVKLPCGCANSAYHILCITQLLQSGEHKNFCPHCKRRYTLVPVQQVVPLQQVVPEYSVYSTNILSHYEKSQQFSRILFVHVLSNTTMNIINLGVIRGYSKYNTQTLFQVVFMFYFFKIFINLGGFIYSKNDIYRIEVGLILSYVYQTIVFGWLVFAISKMKMNYVSTILLVNNLFLGLADFTFRFVIEYGTKNRITAV
jgi:hypothetical protein